jgi:cysteine sulfinate desulfinase/cysteine desulfurase-like protein
LIDLLTLELTLKKYQDKKMVSSVKKQFLEEFEKVFNDDLFFFVDPHICLDFTLHLGLKGIKMRELIRTLAFEDIFITNGEGCSLGLSRPSRILQDMGYSEDEGRWGLSLDFCDELSDEQIQNVVEKIYRKYRQIKVLG